MSSLIIELRKEAMDGRAPVSALLRKALARISEPPLKARFMIAVLDEGGSSYAEKGSNIDT